MAQLSTHVLDTMHGRPAGGMRVRLERVDGGVSRVLATVVLNDDGRNPDGALLDGEALQPGRYRLVFDVAGYFARLGVKLPEPPFLGTVAVDFGVADAATRWHVPLLVSPWAYSTYRGS